MNNGLPFTTWYIISHVFFSILAVISNLLLGADSLVGRFFIVVMALHLVVYMLVVFLQKTKWLYLALSWVTPGSKPVTLIDFEGDTYPTLARKFPDGRWRCPLYYITNTGRCLLLDDGTVDPQSSSSYVRYWVPIKRDELVMHQLVNDIPDLALLRSRVRQND